MAQADRTGGVLPLHNPDPRDWLSAIVEGSDDAIISKDLSGRIQTWNPGASRIFGYTASEVIGKPITILIPEERLDEEPRILAKIRSGERVDHFETVRRRKDGSFVDISLTISPIRDAAGTIVGASKIARDISERRLAEQNQRLLIREMQHRVKNLFAVATSIVTLTARQNLAAEALASTIRDRLSALARAHELTTSGWSADENENACGDLLALIETVLAPYSDGNRVRIGGDHVAVGSHATTNIALLIYELATNAAKYGALSVAKGQLTIGLHVEGDNVRIDWAEAGGPGLHGEKASGFGSQLANKLTSALGATLTRDWRPTGLVITIEIPLARLKT
ncbi:PAS domain S-box protein [Pelagibacterium xiamenense]|uniref:PAS domain S-box protein n=1 Tax=Pelagibacterium xiamenense TaxID=2901140 RepID=UPI001E3BFB04|nr:PAS domain S-box protein [Pelagibacterium xiamenense]MCD7060327.1 PAS domain S-box protein [Pelagibacterium xiamenense]